MIRRATVALCTLLLTVVAGADEAGFSLSTLAKATSRGLKSKGCLDYCVTGACLYLNCGPLGCSVVTMPRVRHRLPDLVVSSWRGHHPWRELRRPLRSWAKKLGISSGGSGWLRKPGTRNASFREADVFANPLANLPLPGLCRASTFPFQPHYSSLLDAHLWRSGLTELLLKETWQGWKLGGPDNSPGSLFPRKGFGHFSADDNASLVTAQRALDIAESGGLHLRWPIRSGDGKTTAARLAPGRSGRTADDDCWQQIYPVLGAKCQTARPPQPRQAAAHAWQVWTRYQCCLKAPGKLIHVLSLPELCAP